MPTHQTTTQSTEARENSSETADDPLLYRKREQVADNAYSGTTTSCQTTSNPADYGPDD